MEGILGKDALLDIGGHEPARIVARQAIGHLRQIVGAEAEERHQRRNFAGAQCGARRFNHHTQTILEVDP